MYTTFGCVSCVLAQSWVHCPLEKCQKPLFSHIYKFNSLKWFYNIFHIYIINTHLHLMQMLFDYT